MAVSCCLCSSAELDAEVKDEERELRKIIYISVRFWSILFCAVLVCLFVFKNKAFLEIIFLHFFVAFPSWFGEFLHRRSLLQVSLMSCGSCWDFFPFSC